MSYPKSTVVISAALGYILYGMSLYVAKRALNALGNVDGVL